MLSVRERATRSIVLVVLALVAGLFPVLPSESRAAEPGSRIELAPIGGIASSRTAPADEAIVKPHELVVAAGPIDELDSYAEAQRRLLERAWDVPVTDLRSAAAADSETSEEAEPRSDSRQLVPITSSDLSGDGHEDVVYFDIGRDENSFMSDVSLSAHDGRSGRLLWSHDYGLPYNLLVLSPGDVTGDGRDDVLVLAIAQSWTRSDIPCAQPACAYDDVLGIEWGVALLSGADGTSLWTRDGQGSVRYTGAYAFPGPLITVARRTEATDALIDVRPSDDIDGDGLRDFTFNLLSYAGEIIFNQKLSWEPLTYSTDAVALSGVDGSEIFSRSESGHSGPPLLLPAGDASGDGRSDLMWTTSEVLQTPTTCPVPGECVAHRSVGFALEMIDGANLSSLWEAEIAEDSQTDAAPVLAGNDLDGDGKVDPVVGLELADGSERAIALSGSGGTQLWRFDTRLTDPPSAIGSIDGGAGNDVLFWEGWYPTEEEAPGVVFRIRLRRVDGATGTERFMTQHDLPESERIGIIYAYEVGDVDGDSHPDIAHALWDYSGSWDPNGSARTVLRVESASDGHDIVSLERDRKALLFDGGDIVRGGGQDLLEGSTTYNDTDFRLAGVEMPTGKTLWERIDLVYLALFGVLEDRTGGADDVVYGRTRFASEAPRWRSRVDVLRGADGARAWGVGAPFGDPPIPEPTPDPTPTPTPSPTIGPPISTELRFTKASARAGQYSDRARLEVRLVDEDGAPIADGRVEFSLGSSRRVATTRSDGVARTHLPLVDAPGRTTVAASFAGSDGMEASEVTSAFQIHKEKSKLKFVSRDGWRRLVVALSEDSGPLAGKPVSFKVDGRSFGRDRTNASGKASRWMPRRLRSGEHTFKVRFAGNRYYKASSVRR